MSIIIPEVNLVFAGCGSFFADQTMYQTNIIVEAKYPDGKVKRLLFDCGTDAKFSLSELGLKHQDIDAVYVSHQHGDHSGGLEWLGFGCYFGSKTRPKLICEERLMHELWENGLKGAMTTLPGKTATLSEFFDCCAVPQSGGFYWSNIYFALHQTVHVCSGMSIKHCYGLMLMPAIKVGSRDTAILKRSGADQEVMAIENDELAMSKCPVKLWDSTWKCELPAARYGDSVRPKVLITGDTRFDPSLFSASYNEAGLIVHDCETANYKSGVHPSYDELRLLPHYIRQKTLLCHYQPTNEIVPEADGFVGFAKKGQRVRIW